MGFYINPKKGTKEDFLKEHGEIYSHAQGPLTNVSQGDEVAVCLVDNGQFTAAGICYSKAELEAFKYPDGRFKIWYFVKAEAVREFLHGQKIEGLDN